MTDPEGLIVFSGCAITRRVTITRATEDCHNGTARANQICKGIIL
jgi:hypothetical protein